jgi:hypothetical protein
MDERNPYAPPRAELDGSDGEVVIPWRLEGATLVVRKGTTLPPVCLFDGSHVEHGGERRELSWTPIWFRTLWVFATLLAMLTYSTMRRTGTIELTLGKPGRARRRSGFLVGAAGVIAAVLLFVLAALSDYGAALVLLALLLVTAAIIIASVLAPFRVVKIDLHHVRLRLRPVAAAAFARLPPPAPIPAGDHLPKN